MVTITIFLAGGAGRTRLAGLCRELEHVFLPLRVPGVELGLCHWSSPHSHVWAVGWDEVMLAQCCPTKPMLKDALLENQP